MKDLSWLFISIAVTFTWCAMWFVVIVNPDMVFPDLLHVAFLGVAAGNGFNLYQAAQVAKMKAVNQPQIASNSSNQPLSKCINVTPASI